MSVTSVLGKRERPPYAQHFYPSAPGAMPSVPNRASGPQAPPSRGGSLVAQSRSTVKYLETNPTASIPLMIRPWADHYEKDYAPGCLIFCKQDKSGRSPLITVADVPTMNYLFHEGEGRSIQTDKTALGPDDFEFFGVFRNDAGKQVDHMGFPRYTNPKQRLIQCDVYGRAKVANFWGKKLRTGQRLGMALVVKSVTMVKQPNRHPRNLPSREYMFQLIPTVNECRVGTNTKLDPLGTGVYYTQADPNDYLTRAYEVETHGVYIKHWHVGVASQSAYEPPTDAKINLALHDSQQRTDLPQIEILMI